MRSRTFLSRDQAPVRGYRFCRFELDLERRSLLRRGEPVEIQDQPLDLLQYLLEHPGRLIRRQELFDHLWPPGTYVDFDRGLNTAMRKVRRALGDDASSPGMIETVPRRGYRFIAPVRVLRQRRGVMAALGAAAARAREIPLHFLSALLFCLGGLFFYLGQAPPAHFADDPPEVRLGAGNDPAFSHLGPRRESEVPEKEQGKRCPRRV